MTEIAFDAKTHSGRVREHNEDQIFGCGKQRLWIVADGMGGHACGELASEIVVQKLSESCIKGKSLTASIELAHAAVTWEAEQNPDARGMGATVVAMSVTGNQYSIAWVGDSRAYRLRNNALELLTRDHSYLEWLKANGITVDEARKHPKRNVITQSIGVGEPVADLLTGHLESGDRYLLCSDGLNDELTDEEIATVLRLKAGSDHVTQALIDQALERGGRDNISAVVVDIGSQHSKSAFLSSTGTGLQRVDKSQWVIVGSVLAAIAIAVMLIVFR